jgi:hypothetical protein
MVSLLGLLRAGVLLLRLWNLGVVILFFCGVGWREGLCLGGWCLLGVLGVGCVVWGDCFDGFVLGVVWVGFFVGCFLACWFVLLM